MAKVRVGGRAASSVGRLLRTISCDAGVAPDVRADAAHWANSVRPTMDERDLQTVAWVLLDASQDKTIPLRRRRSARYWAANLGSQG